MRYLLDTCVISETATQTPEPKVLEFLDSLESRCTFLSVLTIGELKRGIERVPQSSKKQRLTRWLDEDVLVRFAGQIAPIDLPVMLEWGRLLARLESRGRVLPAMDSLIAAIALAGDFTLITRNERDFADTGVRVVNPWA